jgi:hypothetical protein
MQARPYAVHEVMDVDGWIDMWMHECLHAWTNGCIHSCMYAVTLHETVCVCMRIGVRAWQVKGLRSALGAVRAGCEELEGCGELRALLGTLLEVGNFLNEVRDSPPPPSLSFSHCLCLSLYLSLSLSLSLPPTPTPLPLSLSLPLSFPPSPSLPSSFSLACSLTHPLLVPFSLSTPQSTALRLRLHPARYPSHPSPSHLPRPNISLQRLSRRGRRRAAAGRRAPSNMSVTTGPGVAGAVWA